MVLSGPGGQPSTRHARGAQPKLSSPGRLQTLTLAVLQIKDMCACQTLAAASSVLIPMRNSMVKTIPNPRRG